MRAQTVEVKESNGRILCSTVFHSGGKKLLAKGHMISQEDIRALELEGMSQVWVAEIEDGEIGEDDAVCTVASEMGCGCYEIRMAPGGRAILVATENCCVLVDDDLLKQLNYIGSVVVASCTNFSYAATGQQIASVKSTPFAVAKEELDTVISLLRERGPILQARRIRSATVSTLYTDATSGARAQQLFETVMSQRLGRFGIGRNSAMCSIEDEASVAAALDRLLRAKPSVILLASTTSPAGPDDAIGRAMVRAGGSIERFLAPVEPGSLLLLSYKDDIPMISAPGCFRSAKPNVLDMLMPPVLARYRVSGWDVGSLGHGGLLG